MSRYHFWMNLINQEGQPISSADISIYKSGTTTPVYVYNAENGGTATNTTPQTTTDSSGYFEFWIGDDSEIYGYSLGQKYKITWERSGVTSGNVDYVDIAPGVSEVDETDNTSSSKNKVVSNLLAYGWNTHSETDVTVDGFSVHGLSFVNLDSEDDTLNKVISDEMGKSWEDHKDFVFTTYTSETTASSGAHGLASVNKDGSSVIYNKLVSDQLIKDIYDNLDNVAESQYTDQDAQDAVGDILSNDGNITFTYTPSGYYQPSITASVSASNFDHNLMYNYVENEHIDHTTITISPSGVLNGGGTIDDDVYLGFSNLDIDHDQLTNFDTNKHIDHTSVNFTAGTGLSGGGTIATNRTFNLDVDSLTIAPSANLTADYLVMYDTNESAHKKVSPDNLGISSGGGGGGGSGLPQLFPDNMSLDDTDTNVSWGSAFSMIETVDFGSSTDGAVWITIHFPSTLDDTTDINLDVYYHLSGSDDSKVVRFITDYWCTAVGVAPSVISPDDTNTDDISTGVGEDGEIRKTTLTSISNLDISDSDTITLKFTREGSSGSDTYTGTFQILYVYPYQL